MTIQEFAEKLDGGLYGSEVSSISKSQAEENGFVVVFGHSDDTTTFAGAIGDEADGFDGADIFVTKKGIVTLEEPFDDLDEQIDFLKRYGIDLSKHKITAVWNDSGSPLWHYKTDIPHATFDVFFDIRDETPFCKGIVFDIKSLD